MAEIGKAVGQWIIANVGWSVVIFLFLLSCLFKITKIELDPLGWIIGWFGRMLTKDVRKDISDFKKETNHKFEEVKKDRAKAIEDLKTDYNTQITDLRSDLDSFETKTNKTMAEIQKTSQMNCKTVKKEVEEIKKSNDMQTIRQIRAHVLDFANSCMNHRKHSKQEFENIIDENTKYEALVKKYKLKNAVYKEEYSFIMKQYHYCQDNDCFLRDPESEVAVE